MTFKKQEAPVSMPEMLDAAIEYATKTKQTGAAEKLTQLRDTLTAEDRPNSEHCLCLAVAAADALIERAQAIHCTAFDLGAVLLIFVDRILGQIDKDGLDRRIVGLTLAQQLLNELEEENAS